MSDTIKGASCIKGAAFGTSSRYVKKVNSEQKKEEIVDAAIERITDLETQLLIDPTSNLRDRAVLIYSGD